MPEIMTQTVHADPVMATPGSRTARQREDRDGISQEIVGKAGANAPTPTEAPDPAKRARKTVQDLMQEVAEQLHQLTAQKRALAKRQRAEARARTAQVESMIGAACRADKSTHAVVKAALDKQVLDPKLRAFLKAEGWLAPASAVQIKETEK
jgi:hypothetical protein